MMINKIKNIGIIIIVLLVIQSCSILGLIQSKKEITGDYIIELKPKNTIGKYDMSINVIQGIAAYNDGWFTTQTSAGKFLGINYLNNKGESIYDIRLNVDSHGQDLSVEKINDNLLYLYTTVGHFNEVGTSGLLRLKVEIPNPSDLSTITVKMDKEYDLKLDNCTPTLSEDKKSFAIRSGNTIIVASKLDVLNEDLSKATKFNLDRSQLKDKQQKTLWFQGIAMKDDKIYCLTGNSSFGSPKYIYIYNRKGEVLQKYLIDKEDYKNQLGQKLEPESLTFVGDDLYYIIMIKGKTGGNRKLLNKINI